MKKNILYIVIGIIIVVGLAVPAVRYWQAKKAGPSITGTGLTPEERAEILRQLAESTENTPPLSEKERQSILEELEKSSKDAPTLSEEERKAILESLSQ